MIDATAPHTRIDNTIILNMADIGVYGFAVYAAIKQHMNQETGACFPSYARIAKITGMNRSTVIEYTKKLIARKLISREWRFKKDGSHTSNQFDFTGGNRRACSAPVQTSTSAHQGSSLSRPPLVHEPDHPSPLAPPEQSPLNKLNLNKKEESCNNEISVSSNQGPGKPGYCEKTVPTTEKQKECPHPYCEVVTFGEGITICNHCFSLIDFLPDAEAA